MYCILLRRVFVFYFILFFGIQQQIHRWNNLQGLQKTKTLDTETQNTKQPRRITQKKQCFCRGVLQTEWDTCK